jgi:hypothetical protein
MLPALMLSCFIFPIENVPIPLQLFSNILPRKMGLHHYKSIMVNPLRYLIDVIRLIMIKRIRIYESPSTIFRHSNDAAIFNFWVVFNYKKAA